MKEYAASLYPIDATERCWDEATEPIRYQRTTCGKSHAMNREEIMRTNNRIALLAVIGLVVSASARADTLPPGAQPISGTLAADTGIHLRPLPITIPDGWVFVLTDHEVSSQGVQIFSAEDPTYPRWRSVGSYSHSFQTGLVFSTPPLISIAGPFGGFFSFSGYLLPAL